MFIRETILKLKICAENYLNSMTKVNENIQYRDEWTKFSEKINVDLNKVVETIKVRPTIYKAEKIMNLFLKQNI